MLKLIARKQEDCAVVDALKEGYNGFQLLFFGCG